MWMWMNGKCQQERNGWHAVMLLLLVFGLITLGRGLCNNTKRRTTCKNTGGSINRARASGCVIWVDWSGPYCGFSINILYAVLKGEFTLIYSPWWCSFFYGPQKNKKKEFSTYAHPYKRITEWSHASCGVYSKRSGGIQ